MAAGAGVRRPSLLYHFASKEALYEAVVRAAFGELGEALRGAMGRGGTLEERLDATVAAYRDFLDSRPEVARLILRELLDGRGPGQDLLLEQIAPLKRAVVAFLEQAGAERLRPGVDLGAALMQVAANGLVRAGAGRLRQPLWGPGASDELLARALVFRDEAAQTARPPPPPPDTQEDA